MQPFDSSQTYSDPLLEPEVGAAWERFVAREPIGARALRRPVDSSWHRCQAAGVDPGRIRAPRMLSDASLLMRRETCSDLLEASAEAVQRALTLVSQSRMILTLCDADGTILSSDGDDTTMSFAEEIRLVPGAAWNELDCGTNAIGTAIATKAPVQIHAAEHYCEGIKLWTCSAAVIRHPLTDDVLGVINLSASAGEYSRERLGLAVTTACRVENVIAVYEMKRRRRLLETAAKALAASHSTDEILLFDRTGTLVTTNHASVASTSRVHELAGRRRLRALSLTTTSAQPLVNDLPGWLRPEWVEPVVSQGERLGTLLIVPPAGRSAFSARGDEGL
jgi:transcriptional regulator of acetoin/glycerol metabolism